MDPLSQVVRAVKLNAGSFYLVAAAAPWSVSALAARELSPRILPEAEHLISYHILLSRSCWAASKGVHGGNRNVTVGVATGSQRCMT